MRNCTADDALDRLWQTCAWRGAPWIGEADVPQLVLRPRSVWRFLDVFILYMKQCGLPSFDTLPHLVIGNIMELIPSSDYLWC
jgi:hypothetical protein